MAAVGANGSRRHLAQAQAHLRQRAPAALWRAGRIHMASMQAWTPEQVRRRCGPGVGGSPVVANEARTLV